MNPGTSFIIVLASNCFPQSHNKAPSPQLCAVLSTIMSPVLLGNTSHIAYNMLPCILTANSDQRGQPQNIHEMRTLVSTCRGNHHGVVRHCAAALVLARPQSRAATFLSGRLLA